MNSRSLFSIVFHGGVTATYFCAIIAFEKLPPLPHQKSHEHFAGRWKFLTFWNLIAQFLFFAFSFVIEFMKTSSNYYYRLARIRDKMYAGIAMPYAMFVVAVFWTLYAIDRELIFPKILDDVFPVWLNHVGHTLILPVLLVETYMIRHRHPRRKDGLAITGLFGLVYAVWVLYLALGKGIWPYPILYILNWGQRVAFFGVGLLSLLVLYIIGEKINACCWGEGIVSKSK